MTGDRFKGVRNVLIILTLAAAVWRLPGGGTGAGVITSLINIVFWAGLVFFAYRVYMERRTTLMSWEDNLRVKLYVSVGLMIFLVVATARLFGLGSMGALLWFALLGVSLWGVFTAVKAARAY
ncbi:MAG: hypothetical protein M3P40_04945 [Actinomycetota bacterium]|nr:hypothetical protein [Actinomycetota bacterium]